MHSNANGQQQVLPLDPLTPQEIALAARIANDDARVKREIGPGRHRLIQIQFLAPAIETEPGQDLEALKRGRYAAVLFYRYDTDQGINVVVDLNEESVGEITRVDGRGVPLALDEVNEAFGLALHKRELRVILGPQAQEFGTAGPRDASPENRVEGLRVVATSPRDPCYRHRCVELHFRRREGYVPATSVTVDLSAQQVKVDHPVK